MSCNCNKEHGVCCGDSEGNDDIRNDLIRIAVTAALFVAAFIAELVFHAEWYIYVGLFAAAYTACSYEAYIDCVRNIAEGEIFNESFLMIIASLGAFCIGQYPEAVAVMMFFGVGELFEDYAVDRSRKSVSALLQIVPDHAWVLRDGKEVQVNPSEVETGETIIIRSGERVPLDCVITSGSSSMDTVALTGESVPRSVFPGNEILAGMVNVTAKLTAEVIRPYSESAVSRIMRMIEESSSKKAKTERFIRVFAKYYTPAVCALALSVAAIPIALGYDAGTWIYRALTLLVVSCPCALVISVPMGFFCGIGCASRNGILVKGGNYLEMLSKADTIVFDKTGTLTEGTFEVTSIKPVEMTSEELMEMAVKAEYYSDHPISASIKRGYGKVPTPDGIGESEVIPGRGVRTEVHGRSVHIGNLKLMSEIGISVTEHDTPGTKVHVARDGKYHGHIEVADTVKNDSKWAVSELKKLGINRTVMLTGDIGRTAGVVGRDIGIDDIRADLLPGQKLEALEEIMSTFNGSTVFIGDGINDAPSLARADVGIAMGGIGSDAAIEAADIVLVNDAPSGAVTVLRIAKKTMSVVKQNIVFPLTIKVAIIVLAAVGIAGMPVAIFGDVGVLIIAILNSTRCLTVKGTVPKEYSRYADKAEKNV